MKTESNVPEGFVKMTPSDMMALSGEERFFIASIMFQAWRAKMISKFPPGLSEREFKRLLYERTYGEPAPLGFPGSPHLPG